MNLSASRSPANARALATAAALWAACLPALWPAAAAPAGARVETEQSEDRVLVRAAGEDVATYVFRDPAIPRPYFAHVKAPGGIPVTRTHPPVPGRDATDHATFHPGIWMAFGDISGADSWRLKAVVRHEGFAAPPAGGEGRGGFAARNAYLSAVGARTVARELCSIAVRVRPTGTLLLWDSRFSAGEAPLVFGDQEEMGLGARVATALAVTAGGAITDSEGRRNEAQVRGKAPAWCDYGGVTDGRRVGIALMQHPANFRPSWIHARDYGFFAANPFGRRSLTGGEESRLEVRPGETLRLRYGILLHSAPAASPVDLAVAYRDYLAQAGAER